MFKLVLGKMFRCRGAWALSILTIAGFAASSFFPLLNGTFIDLLVRGADFRAILLLAAFIAFVGIASAALSYSTGMLSARIGTRASFSILEEQLEKLERTRLDVIERRAPDYVTQQISNDSSAVTTFVISNYLSCVLNGVAFLFATAVFILIDPALLALAVCLVAVYGACFVKLRRPLKDASKRRLAETSSLFSSIGRQLSNVFEIQLRSLYGQSRDAVRSQFGSYLPAVMRSSRLACLLSSADGIAAAAFQAVVLLVSGARIISGQMTIGQLTMTSAYFTMMLGGAKYYIGFYRSYQETRASLDRMRAIAGAPRLESGSEAVDGIRTLELVGLSYSVGDGGDERALFSDFSRTFSAGRTYAVVGENGSGKSTLLKILTGLYPVGGAVAINGRPISDLDMHRVRRERLFAVPQILSTSAPGALELAEELSGVEGETELRRRLSEDGSCFARTVEASLGKGATSLSGGEARRIYLWAAIRSDADVLLLDEPTTGLDGAARAALLDYVGENPDGRMIIAMTHDAGLAAEADETVDLGEL